jgi:hypothetical protein
VAGESSRTTTAATRPQREGATVVPSQVLVPRDPHQGRGGEGARSESQSIRGRGVIEAPIGGDSVPRRGRSRRSSRQAPKPERGVLVVRSDGCVMS